MNAQDRNKQQEAKDRAYILADALAKSGAALHGLGYDLLDAAVCGKDPVRTYRALGALLRKLRSDIYAEATFSDTERVTPAATSDESLAATFLGELR